MLGSKSSSKVSYKSPFYARTRFLFIILLVIAVYSYGWRVTEIELGELVQDIHLVKPLIRDLLRPDILTFQTKTESANAFFALLNQQPESTDINKNF